MEEVTAKIVNYLLLIVVVLLGLMFNFSYIRREDLLNVIPLAPVLIVFAVPVALPAMFTISLAIGSMEAAKKGALLTRLNAMEDTATMDTLCVDKTGTLTQNKLTVSEIVPLNGHTTEEVILYGYLALEESDNDPIDLAFINQARNMNIQKKGIIMKDFRGFDPATRRTGATVSINGEDIIVTKGAVETILILCGNQG